MTDQTTIDKATAVRQRHANLVSGIKADQTLSLSGQREALNRATDTANAELAKLRDKAAADTATRRSTLERKLLAAPSPGIAATEADKIAATMSFRDALARAEGMTDGAGLVGLQESARLAGDRALERAAFAVGMRRADTHAVNAFVEANPSYESDSEELFAAMHGGGMTTAGLIDAWTLGPVQA